MPNKDLNKDAINHYLGDEIPHIKTEEEVLLELQEQFNTEMTKFQESSKIVLKIKNTSDNQNPEYQTNGSSGFDLRANIPSGHMHLEPLERDVISTGLFFEIPVGFEVQIRPRSGLAAKQGVTVLNTPGTIDQDYRGEIKIILINLGSDTVTINHGDRIAQAILAPVTAKEIVNIEIVNDVNDNTDRGSGGFGHTGLQ